MMLFITSKYYEFFDTALMMGKSYRIIFLHWWHHATVPVLCAIHMIEVKDYRLLCMCVME